MKGPAVKGRCMRRRVVAGVGNGAAWACWVTSYSTNLPKHREAITQRGPWSAAKRQEWSACAHSIRNTFSLTYINY